ncbi:transposase family protein [Rosistilla oblonga]|uniref:transposase family protein n=1 Tax=Rosistilla oblonga TaxID=2527990 RepID=UPI003A979523
MLAAIICGLLTGARGCAAIAQWLHDQEPEFWHSIGFLRKPPTSNCFRDVFLGLPPDSLENAVRSWVTEYLVAVAGELWPGALDGKTFSGTLQARGQSIHLLAMFDTATGGVIAQARMPATPMNIRWRCGCCEAIS